MNKPIDLSYVKEEQEKFSKHLQKAKGIKPQINTLKVSEKQILHLQSELFEVLNEIKLHKDYDNEIDRNRVIEELSDCLSIIGNIANSIGVELILENETKEIENPIKLFRNLIYDISRMDKTAKVGESRRKLKYLIVPQFIDFVYSCGFDLKELKEAYFIKMSKNYHKLKFV